MKKRALQDALFGILGCDALLSQSSAVSQTTLLRKREVIKRVRKSLPGKVSGADEYDVSWLRICGVKNV